MQGTISFELVECYKCGMPFYMTGDFNTRRRDDHGWFYCPAGHGQHYTRKSEAEKLREELASAVKLKDHFKDQAGRHRLDRERVERRLSAMKGQVTKANNKLKKGVCPCCDQQFPDLENHIFTCHPDFDIDQSGMAVTELVDIAFRQFGGVGKAGGYGLRMRTNGRKDHHSYAAVSAVGEPAVEDVERAGRRTPIRPWRHTNGRRNSRHVCKR